MKRTRVYVCALLFVALTAVKLVAPAAAADVRGALLGQITRDDDYKAAAAVVQRALTGEQTAVETVAEPRTYTVATPVEQMEQARAAHTHVFFTRLPAELLHPTPSAEVETELEHSAAMDAAYQARETFLAAQSEFSDRALPANVSYDIPELPFQTASPVAGYTSSGFGYRMHPIQETVKFHYGTDFAAGSGTDIHAFADGTVLAAGEDAGYGNYVKIQHEGGFVTLYGHCSALLVSAGQRVSAGDVIARVGATGQATGPHLHFELIHEGVYLNPEFYLAV